MRRSQTLPIETMAAITLILAASLLAAIVVVRDAADGADTDRAAVATADRSAVTTTPPRDAPPGEPPASTPTTSTTAPVAPSPSPSRRPATTPTTSPSTTTTTTEPAAPPTSEVEGPPECPGLVSHTRWNETGDAALLTTAAGGRAEYAEVVTNTADEPCTLATNRCGTTAQVRTTRGERTDAPPLACTDAGEEVVLEPGEQRTELLTVDFPVPPGRYDVHIRRYDGTAVTLPVELDDRLPPCPPDGLRLRVNGDEQVRDRTALRDAGFSVDLILAGVAQTCSVRTVESRMHLQVDDQQIDIVDATDRWLASPEDAGIFTHVVVPPGDIPAGEYDGRITLVLESGDRLAAPFRLTVG